MIDRLPEKYIQTMKGLLEEEFEDYIHSFECQRYYGLRVNTLKIKPEELQNKNVFDLNPIPWCEEGFYYSEDASPTKHPYYYAGLYYIQEPSAMAPATVLPIEPGDKVLDLCAAPGGKSTHLGAKLKGEGVLVCNDISFSRAKALLKNVELFGLTNALVVSEDPSKLVQYFEGYFDKILVDAPCSGEGMFRKDPSIIKSWETKGVDYYSDLQIQILPYAAKMLKPGGLLLYSTCTFSPMENEGTILNFLENHPDFYLIPIDKSTGFADGRPDWIKSQSNDVNKDNLKKTARLWPHKIEGEGHYLALMQKSEEPVYETNTRMPIESQPSKNQLKDFHDFCEVNLNKEIKANFAIYGENLLLMPEDIPQLKGLRVLRTGWLLGTLKKGRFEPHTAFALGLKMEDVKRTLNLESDDPRVLKYLKGETIEWKEEGSGWVLVGVDGLPLGWGKLQKGKIKNKYAKGWRML